MNNKLRKFIYERDGYKCQVCTKQLKEVIPYKGSLNKPIYALDIHHFDGNKNNNSHFNLTTICRQCHVKVHSNSCGWARKYKKCIRCNKTKYKHVGRGLCKKCYSYIYEKSSYRKDYKAKWHINKRKKLST